MAKSSLIRKLAFSILFILLVCSISGWKHLAYVSESNLPVSKANVSDIPYAPTLLSPSDDIHTEDSSPTFSWTEVLDTTYYTLQIDNNSEFSSDNVLVIENLSDTSHMLTLELNPGRWFWRVSAENASGVSQYSEVWQFVIIPPRNPPIEIMATTLGVILVFSIIFVSFGLWFKKKKTTHKTITRKPNPIMFSALLAITGVFTPYAMMYQSFTDPSTSDMYLTINLVSILWTYLITADSAVLAIVSGYVLVFSLIVFVFQLVFVFSIYEYFMNEMTRFRVFGAWIISQIPIIFISLPRYMSGAYPGSLFYSGPTFITLIIGYAIIRFYDEDDKDIWMEK